MRFSHFIRPSLVAALVLATMAYALLGPGAGQTSSDLLTALLHPGTEGFAPTVVWQWRAPRVVAALIVGMCLGISGALFQVLTHNPLGSPDIIGFNTGAYTGVIVVTLAGFSSALNIALGALGGGAVAAFVIMALTFAGRLSGPRLIVVGIGVTFFLSAVNKWLILSGELEQSLGAATWAAGTLSSLSWAQVVPLGALGLIACVLGLFLRGWCDVLTLGETPAATLGLDVNRARVAMVCIGTVLIALSTALVGPISFIALAAPHIARMISRTARTPLLLSGVIGALFLLVADTAGQRLFSPITLPAGLITVCAGGIYLVGLLLWQSRSTSAKGR
ncbi:FecCD family ABC transporter permease [Corynebacterium massiliense]|uniref:Ferric enterobactin transport system permease protein FepG n=1 Tax=Corynebacterium massiliense DSM 45435 TaxID=1121364 RepID=A0ABY7UBS1_9CORY|nr:iron chelate uptake ABC transporter family permease subunit [Corynebacterium massiliense]WCZ32912.1 Ferric enterobactin transport system permease protein FepG [Corynebacterium massiliense DSM 45435]